jgi:hypothetical protein
MVMKIALTGMLTRPMLMLPDHVGWPGWVQMLFFFADRFLHLGRL